MNNRENFSNLNYFLRQCATKTKKFFFLSFCSNESSIKGLYAHYLFLLLLLVFFLLFFGVQVVYNLNMRYVGVVICVTVVRVGVRTLTSVHAIVNARTSSTLLCVAMRCCCWASKRMSK